MSQGFGQQMAKFNNKGGSIGVGKGVKQPSRQTVNNSGGKGKGKGGDGKAAKQTYKRNIKRGQQNPGAGGISHVWHAVLTGGDPRNLESDHDPRHIQVKSIFTFKTNCCQ